MPVDYSKYPANWKTEIRPRILNRAKNCCEAEGCGVPNYTYGYWDQSGKFWSFQQIEEALHDKGVDLFDQDQPLGHIPGDKKCVRVVLTVAHLNHDVNDNRDENLKALCQWHHLNHDKQHHKEQKKKNKGLQDLFQ